MEQIEKFIFFIDNALDTKRKRHLIGGMFLSVSLLLGGLAVTVLSVKEENNE